ncbi:MAG: PadR family transcriptional regulator [Saprospiraceae bacterium]
MITRITALDYAIMGLLQEGAKTGYVIRQVFEQTALGTYSSSPGSIYPALKKLEKRALVIKKALAKGDKEQFVLLPAGKTALLAWLNSELQKEDIEKHMTEVLLKFAFMETLLSKKKRIDFLKNLAALLEEHIHELKTFHQMHTDLLSLHGRLALENGIEGQAAHLRWTRHAIKEIRHAI